MPGFNIAPFGGGYSAVGPTNVIEPKRQNRWVFESLGRGAGSFSQAELLVLQSAQRPTISLKPVDMHHNQEVARFAGKHEFEPIELVWYDIEQDPNTSRGLYHWIETVVNMRSMAVAHPRYYKRHGTLALLNGIGQYIEVWTLLGTWPETCNFQKLDYQNAEILTCQASMRYDRAVLGRTDGSCISPPPPTPITPNCPV